MTKSVSVAPNNKFIAVCNMESDNLKLLDPVFNSIQMHEFPDAPYE
jgi:hypothetical protein